MAILIVSALDEAVKMKRNKYNKISLALFIKGGVNSDFKSLNSGVWKNYGINTATAITVVHKPSLLPIAVWVISIALTISVDIFHISFLSS